jgi:beta-mannosidase
MVREPADGIRVDNLKIVDLTHGWQLARAEPGSVDGPNRLRETAAEWRPAAVPGTVAESLHQDINAVGNYDADDWWYRTTFEAPAGTADGHRLNFEGLATLARVWLNGTPILSSQNMFVAQSVDVTLLPAGENELVILFESLGKALAVRRPRPRWKTALVDHQNLRWFRTTLLGRIPGWTPPITPVGPWRPITLHCASRCELAALDLDVRARGTTGLVGVRARVRVFAGHALAQARLRLGEDVHPLDMKADAENIALTGALVLPDIPLWWPHTHGTPRLLDCALEVRVDDSWLKVWCGPVGFKQVTLDQSGGVQFLINDVPVFCRGACWTTADFTSLRGDPGAMRRTLEAARDAGLNMLRVGGTMVYESTSFYRLCDELGILVWQDFMFANMDYPVENPEFHAQVDAEVRHQLGRLQRHVCIAAYCGGSEVAQQAAMLGRPASEWTNAFFAEELPRLCAELHESIPYFPATPWGGALPFHVGAGISHYYGVGAYRRPPNDVKHAGVKFTTECLGFSNVPDRETIELMYGGVTPPPHHPRWKARVPRDSGAGWDFEDIRDHYFRELLGRTAVDSRSVDVERYYALSRIVSGELMKGVFNEWRKPGNPCSGGLVWFFQDLWPGAGWGIVDSTGRPKAAFWYLKRAWANRTVWLSDEGLDGLDLVLLNESPESMHAQVEIRLFQHGQRTVATAQSPADVPARGALTLQADALLGRFTDISRAYRFGPPQHDVVNVRLYDRNTRDLLGEDFYFPGGLDFPVLNEAGVAAHTTRGDDGRVRVTLRSAVFLQSVCVSSKNFAPSDNYFHMAPDTDKHLVFSPLASGQIDFKADFEALNAHGATTARAAAAG